MFIPGTIFRLKGSILAMSFLDFNGALIKSNYESWKDSQKDKKEGRRKTIIKIEANTSSVYFTPLKRLQSRAKAIIYALNQRVRGDSLAFASSEF